MYATGNPDFAKYACSPNRTIDTKVVVAMQEPVELGTDDIVSYKATYASTGGKSFAPGSFVASQLELSLNVYSPAVAGINFKSADIPHLALQAGVKVYKTMVYVPMGTFYIDNDGVDAGDNGYVSIKATDLPPVLNTEFNSNTLTFPCTVLKALETMASNTGLSLNLSEDDFPNLAVMLDETFTLVATYREAFMYIAETLGAYVSMGRAGEICLKRVFSGKVDLGCVLDDNYLFSVSLQENSVKPFQYIGIKASKDDLGVTQEVTGISTGCRYDILGNPLTYGHSDEFLSGLVGTLSFEEFYPSKVSFQGRPDLDTGDVLEYVYKGVTYLLPVCNHVFEYNGGFKTTVESIGSSQENTSSTDSGVKTQVSALRQQINSLVRDLTKTQSQIIDINGEITNMSSLLQTAVELQSQVSALEGDVEKLSTLTQTAENLRIAIETVTKDLSSAQNQISENQESLMTYFDFQADGLTIGVSNSSVKLRLANNRVSFLRDSQEVAYLSEGQLYVTDAHFLKSLVLGNFEFTPRTNGNLSLRRRS